MPARRRSTPRRRALGNLPGKSGFAFTEITDDGPRELFGVNANESFAVGSSFKLYILGTLADEANASRRRLEDLMLLERIHCGPPHSEMAEWPMGSPVTLHTLALKMISISDNTATDHLLYLLGRERIERQMAVMGHSHPEVNRPLLSTAEMTELRDKKTGLPGKAYQKLDEAAKRKFLAEHFQGVPNFDDLDFDTAAYNVAEWYASPMDMARAMEWIYRHTLEGMPARAATGDSGHRPQAPPQSESVEVRRLQGRVRGSIAGGELAHAAQEQPLVHVPRVLQQSRQGRAARADDFGDPKDPVGGRTGPAAAVGPIVLPARSASEGAAQVDSLQAGFPRARPVGLVLLRLVRGAGDYLPPCFG